MDGCGWSWFGSCVDFAIDLWRVCGVCVLGDDEVLWCEFYGVVGVEVGIDG